MRQVSDGQEQIFHLHVGGVAAENDISSSDSDVFLIDPLSLVVNPVDCPFDLKEGFPICPAAFILKFLKS